MDQTNQEGISARKGMSNNTIIILVVTAVLIAAIGTWAVLNSMVPSNDLGEVESNTNVGIVTMTVLPSMSSQSQDTGRLTLTIEK